MKKDTQKTLLTLLTILVCIHTVALFAGYFLFKNKFREMAKIVVSNMQRIDSGLASEEKNVQMIDINIPLYQYLGSEEAPVEIVIITDFQCPYCIKLTNEIFPQIVEDYIDGKLVKISYLPFPLEKIHSHALNAAITASYANENDLFWPAHQYLFENSESLSDDLMIEYIETLGLSGEELKKRFQSSVEKDKIRNTALSLAKSGVTGTPALVVNGKLLTGFKDYKTLTAILNQELKLATKQINNEDAKVINSSKDTVFLDVRTLDERKDGYIEGSIHSDFKKKEEFLRSIDSMDKDKSYIIYCKSGYRSTRAYILMEQAGFKSIYNLSDGFDGWK